jgi:hypothetical protein
MVLWGTLDHSDADAASVIQDAIDPLASGGRIFMVTSSYSLGAGLDSDCQHENRRTGKGTELAFVVAWGRSRWESELYSGSLACRKRYCPDRDYIRGRKSEYAQVSRCWFDKFGAAGKGHGGVNVVAHHALVNPIWDMAPTASC